MSADIIDLRGICEFKEPQYDAELHTAFLNEGRRRLKWAEPHQQIVMVADLAAAMLCEFGGRNASGSLAEAWAGRLIREIITRVNATFPPPGEVPFQ